jgi:peptidoglycan/LPS O-acetylase OafA/YrhL
MTVAMGNAGAPIAAPISPPREVSVPPVKGGVMRFPSIEGLRFWMAWWVVLGHAANLCGIPKMTPAFMSPLFNASVAVNVFIMVSGFVVTHLITSSHEPYSVYITRRAARLWSMYALMLVLLIIFPAAYRFTFVDLPWNFFRQEDAARLASVAQNYPIHIALHAFLLQGLVPHEILPFADSSILSPAWSLSLEWQFYLVAPFWIALLRRSRRAAIISSTVILLIVAVCNAQDMFHWRFPAFLPMSAHFFLVGILSRLALEYRWMLPRLRYYVAGAILLSVGLVIVGDAMLHFRVGREAAIWSLFYLFVLYENGRVHQPTPRLLLALRHGLATNRFASKLGSASYSAYIMHIPMFAFVCYIVSFFFPIDTLQRAIIVVFGTALAVAPLSLLTYRYIEQPCNQWVRVMLKRGGRQGA